MLEETPPDAPLPPRAWGRRLLVGALAAALLYAAMAALADARELAEALRSFQAGSLALALAFVTATAVLRALRWRLYLHRMRATPPDGDVGFAESLAAGLPSGRWGQVAKAYHLRRARRQAYEDVVPAVFAERVADVGSVVLLLALGAATAAGDLRALLAALVALGAAVVVLRSRRAARWGIVRLRRLRWVREHGPRILEGHARLRAHLHARDLAAPVLLGLPAYLFEALALQALAAGFGLALTVGQCALVVGTADLVGLLSLVPAGLVATEGSLVVLLGLQGASLAEATAITILFRGATLWYAVGLGLAGLGALHVVPPWRDRMRPARLKGSHRLPRP